MNQDKRQAVSGGDSLRGIIRFAAALHPGAQQAATVRAVRHERRRRGEFLNSALFADPAWDILLELFLAELEQRRTSVGGLCSAANIPLTTGLRWLDALNRERLISKRADPVDRRRVYVSLSTEASERLTAYFATVPRLCR
jgi:DNA-binding MarR family transcriptional regulator